MRSKLVVWLTVWLVLATVVGYAAYKIGHTHDHTNGSDGTLPPPLVVGKAIGCGDDFLILSDHFTNLVSGNVTVDNASLKVYIATCGSSKIVVVIGTELGAHHGKAISHFVAFRVLPVESDAILHQLNNKEGSLQAMIDRLHELGYLVVAAHPNMKSSTSDFTFEWSHAKGIDGIELGNDGNKTARAKTITQYHDFLKQGILLFVWFGSDSHTPVDPSDKARWAGLTGVDVDDKLTAESLVSAFRQGRSYASFDGIKIDRLDYRIGFTAQQILGWPDFRFDLAVAPGEPAPEVEIFRDGILAGKAVGYRTLSALVRYRFRDTGREVAGKQHFYTLEIADRLVTSPIVLNVPQESAIERVPDGASVRDADGHNPGEQVFGLAMENEGTPALKDLMADPKAFKGLPESAFQNLLEVQSAAGKFREIGHLTGCYTCGDIYADADAKMCDVQVGRRDAKGQHRCGTFQMVLQDNRWRVRSASEGYVNRVGLSPAKVKK